MTPKQCRSTLFAVALFALLAVIPAAAQDVVTVGTRSATGNTVDIPVYIRDVAGTPLGQDRPAGSKIQGISIRVFYAPAAAVQSVTFTRAGIAAGLTPIGGEISPSPPSANSPPMSFDWSTKPNPVTVDAPPPRRQN